MKTLRRWTWARRIWTAVGTLVLVLALILLPPFLNISRYQHRVTGLISQSLGRPVVLSSVELRLLPRPGFVVHDLSVDEDPAFGVEPILHANTVTANIGFLSLWRGELSIGSIQVDEASLNLVRNAQGRWNLDPFLHGAAVRQYAAGAAQPSAKQARDLPTLDATNSRINLKREGEKLPFSLMNAEFSLTQDGSDWRLHLIGQPVRTDVALDLADTGELRMEARLHNESGKMLRQMPLHLQMTWKDAPLGQLSRLLSGTDAGWRGAMAASLVVDGSADSSIIKAQLRATGVYREEFVPASPLDFDASCTLHSQSSGHSLSDLLCNAPIGDGRVRLSGAIAHPGTNLKLELDHLPTQFVLDGMRTLRNGIAEDLEAAGTISGAYDYARAGEQPAELSGAMIVEGLVFKNGGLSEPLRLPKAVIEPAGHEGLYEQGALHTEWILPTNGKDALQVDSTFGPKGYAVALHGGGDSARMGEIAQAFGIPSLQAIGPAGDGLSKGSIELSLATSGEWIPAAGSEATLSGQARFTNAEWRAPFLPAPVKLPLATVEFQPSGAVRWDAPAFTYGSVHGLASVDIPATKSAEVDTAEQEHPHFHLSFSSLDAATLQEALAGPKSSGLGLAAMFDRLNSRLDPRHLLTGGVGSEVDTVGAQLHGDVTAESFALGPVTLRDVRAALVLRRDAAEIEHLEAKAFGGAAHFSGEVKVDGGVPQYQVRGEVSKLNSAELGKLLDERWTGGAIRGSGDITLSGLTLADLGKSATGAFHFDWLRGAIPAQKLRFAKWSGDAAIGAGKITLGDNARSIAGRRGSSEHVKGTVNLGAKPRLTLGH